MAISGKPHHLALKKLIPKIDQELVKKLLHLYLLRCKFVHSLAYLQYRRRMPDAKLHDIMAIFKKRKDFLVNKLNELEH